MKRSARTACDSNGYVEHEDGMAGRVRRFLRERVSGVRELAVEARGGTVLLQGSVSSTDAKRLCVECCRRVNGVIHIIDELAVAA